MIPINEDHAIQRFEDGKTISFGSEDFRLHQTQERQYNCTAKIHGTHMNGSYGNLKYVYKEYQDELWKKGCQRFSGNDN